MFKKVLFSLTVLLAGVSLYALEVNEDEVKSAGSVDTVVFENYAGPHSVINTIDEIKAIGSSMGKVIASSISVPASAGNARYTIFHCVDAQESGKLDADILVLGSDAAVDHIKNLRRIIAAYLSAAYGYSEKDSETIATFVTVYNAVYRGKLDVFNAKYKKIVTDKLTADKAGLALSYREWPGKSQIVIPLSDLSGGLSTVDTSVISDKQVVQSMQEDDDKGVNTRKDMVDIKEREADNAAEKAKQAQQRATNENSQLKQEQKKEQQAKEKAQQAQEDADKAKREADEAQKKAAENPSDKNAQNEAREKQAAAEEKQQEADQKQKEADEQSQKTQEQAQKVSEAKKEADEAQAAADSKRTEAQEERTSIAKDQQALIKEAQANSGATLVYGLKAVDELGVMSELVKMNADTGKVVKESPVTVIRGRTFYEAGDAYIAIAGTNVGNGAVKLVLIDRENMEIIKEGAETVTETSVLVQDGSSYYCVINDGKNSVVAKYNANLDLQLKSPLAVKASTPITVTQKGILVTSAAGKATLLNPADLTAVTDSGAGSTDAK